MDFDRLAQLTVEYGKRQEVLLRKRRDRKSLAHAGTLPNYGQCQVTPSIARTGDWTVELPQWCQDQRNQMTGPADDLELCIKMVNSGAPGVMLDLEDSMVNSPLRIAQGIQNIKQILPGVCHNNATYYDKKQGKDVGIEKWPIIFTRPRGLHIHHTDGSSASFYDVTRVALSVNPLNLTHPLCFYIPKSESAEEALWWRDLFRDVSDMLGKPSNWIKCMALVESHPLAYEMEEFIYNLRDNIIGLNLGRWDYMASLADWMIHDPNWILPDSKTIPHDILFFQNLRRLMVDTCHRRGILAIGGMTALFPNRLDSELNARALEELGNDKRNEAAMGMDGAWTGHPDQNQVAIDSFPVPNQLGTMFFDSRGVDLRPPITVGKFTGEGTRAAIRTSILYRYGVFNGKGASLIDGYMDDLATDRRNRVMIAQRLAHNSDYQTPEKMGLCNHTIRCIYDLFVEETERLIGETGSWDDPKHVIKMQQAAQETLKSILTGQFDPT